MYLDKNEFKAFCKKEFYKHGFIKVKNAYYQEGDNDILGAIFFQKSDFSDSYYIKVTSKNSKY